MEAGKKIHCADMFKMRHLRNVFAQSSNGDFVVKQRHKTSMSAT